MAREETHSPLSQMLHSRHHQTSHPFLATSTYIHTTIHTCSSVSPTPQHDHLIPYLPTYLPHVLRARHQTHPQDATIIIRKTKKKETHPPPSLRLPHVCTTHLSSHTCSLLQYSILALSPPLSPPTPPPPVVIRSHQRQEKTRARVTMHGVVRVGLDLAELTGYTKCHADSSSSSLRHETWAKWAEEEEEQGIFALVQRCI